MVVHVILCVCVVLCGCAYVCGCGCICDFVCVRVHMCARVSGCVLCMCLCMYSCGCMHVVICGCMCMWLCVHATEGHAVSHTTILCLIPSRQSVPLGLKLCCQPANSSSSCHPQLPVEPSPELPRGTYLKPEPNPSTDRLPTTQQKNLSSDPFSPINVCFSYFSVAMTERDQKKKFIWACVSRGNVRDGGRHGIQQEQGVQIPYPQP